MKRVRLLPWFLPALAVGCSEYGFGKPDDHVGTWDGTPPVGSSEADTDTDTDADADADADTDADTDTDTTTDTVTGTETVPGPGDTGDTAGDTGEIPEDLCDKASRTTGYLDHFQVAGDGKVLFCHRGGGPNYVTIDTDISACLSHLDHDLDVFPTTGCDS